MNKIGNRFSWLWVTLYFLILTILMTYPLVLRMADSIVGMVGDNIYFVWLIGWTKKALFDLHVNPFDVWFLNYPQGWNLAYTEITPAQILIAQPFSLIFGPVFAYNATMMLTFIFSGLAMYWWSYRITNRKGAALVSGTIYAFLPYHFAHFRIGHLNLSSIQWFPLYFMGLFELLGIHQVDSVGQSSKTQVNQSFWRPAILTGVSLGLIAMTSQYYIFMTLIISLFLVIYYSLFIDRKMIRESIFWKKITAAGIIATPLILAGIAPYLQLAGEGGLPDRGISLVRNYSAGLTDFILPSTDHFLWGNWVSEHFNRDLWIEGSLYIGIVTGILALYAWVKRHELERVNVLRVLLWCSVCAMILAMGTDVHWNERAVTIPTPDFLLESLGRQELPIVLPGTLLFYVFPLYAKLRAIMRFGIFVLLFTSLAAGLGVSRLQKYVNYRWHSALVAALLGLVFIDFYPGVYTQFAKIEPRPVDYWLSEQSGEGAVVQMPFTQAEDQEHTYYSLTHQKPYVGGFFNAFPPEQYLRIKPVLDRFPDDVSVRLLRELGVQYILVDSEEYSDEAQIIRSCESEGLKFITKIEDQLVFELS